MYFILYPVLAAFLIFLFRGLRKWHREIKSLNKTVKSQMRLLEHIAAKADAD